MWQYLNSIWRYLLYLLIPWWWPVNRSKALCVSGILSKVLCLLFKNVSCLPCANIWLVFQDILVFINSKVIRDRPVNKSKSIVCRCRHSWLWFGTIYMLQHFFKVLQCKLFTMWQFVAWINFFYNGVNICIVLNIHAFCFAFFFFISLLSSTLLSKSLSMLTSALMSKTVKKWNIRLRMYIEQIRHRSVSSKLRQIFTYTYFYRICKE